MTFIYWLRWCSGTAQSEWFGHSLHVEILWIEPAPDCCEIMELKLWLHGLGIQDRWVSSIAWRGKIKKCQVSELQLLVLPLRDVQVQFRDLQWFHSWSVLAPWITSYCHLRLDDPWSFPPTKFHITFEPHTHLIIVNLALVLLEWCPFLILVPSLHLLRR